jgi:hypothetical protein
MPENMIANPVYCINKQVFGLEWIQLQSTISFRHLI